MHCAPFRPSRFLQLPPPTQPCPLYPNPNSFPLPFLFQHLLPAIVVVHLCARNCHSLSLSISHISLSCMCYPTPALPALVSWHIRSLHSVFSAAILLALHYLSFNYLSSACIRIVSASDAALVLTISCSLLVSWSLTWEGPKILNSYWSCGTWLSSKLRLMFE